MDRTDSVDKFLSWIVFTETMQVREYSSGDESSVASIHNAAFQPMIESLPEIYEYKTIGPKDVIDWLAPEPNLLWIAEINGKLVGYAQVRLQIETGKQDVTVLQFMPSRKWDLDQANVAVHPEYQKRGVGTFLVDSILERYSDTADFATAHIFSDNDAGAQLFQALEFTMHDAFYHPAFSEKYPLANSSIYETLELESLTAPANLNSNLVFRRARLHDAPAISEIHQANVWWCDECDSLEWTIRFIKGKLGHTVFVGELNGEVVGEMDYYQDGRIGIAGVLPEFRNQGIGSTMFYKLLRAMQRAGFKSAFVDSGLTQTDAIKMYERFGFKIERRQNCWIRTLK